MDARRGWSGWANFAGVCALAWLGSSVAVLAQGGAPPYTVLHDFKGDLGALYSGVTLAPDGSIYGTTYDGGAAAKGSIFVLRPDGAGGYSQTTLHDFTGANGDGANPTAGLLLASNGNLYGTTVAGGSNGCGTVFRVDGVSGQVETLVLFDCRYGGGHPQASLIEASDGLLYGTTSDGGCGDCIAGGTVFRMEPWGLPVITILHVFAGEAAFPASALLEASDGNFYGTTVLGGSGGQGTVFKLDRSGVVTILHSFTGASDGRYPRASLVGGTYVEGAPVRFYGTTSDGGPNGWGTVFVVDASGALGTVLTFRGDDGSAPAGLLLTPDGSLYGTTSGGSSGTVFRVVEDYSITLHTFDGSDGARPRAALVLGSDGSFYGTTSSTGNSVAAGRGTVFRLDPAGQFTTLYRFGGDEPASPVGGLVDAGDGSFLGTSPVGGAADFGSVFRVTPAGDLAVLHNFRGADGSEPRPALTRATDGNLYGVTRDGGGSFGGTVFRIDPAGTLTTLHAFAPSDGTSPYGRLVQASDGFLYGTTFLGGAGGLGTVFRMSLDGAFSVVHDFDGSGGANPLGGVIEGSDGNLYGTTNAGGASGNGTVFRLDRSGAFALLHSFDSSDGASPQKELIQAVDGNLYGTTLSGGPSGYGTLFQITLSGVLTTLRGFTIAEGQPDGGLLQGSDGNLYATTANGGGGAGTLYRADLAGSISPLHAFDYVTGAQPSGGLLQAADGHLYGVTNAGGAWGRGGVFRVAVGLAAPTAVASGSATVCPGSPTPLSGSGGVSCSWSPALGLDNPASCTPQASPATTTTYTLTVTDASAHLSINKPTVTVTVGCSEATATSLATSTDPSVSGQDVTFTATVTAATGTPTGSVTFSDGPSLLGTVPLGAGGVATLVTSSLTVGSHAITAAYSGDANHATSTSPALTQTVNPPGPVSIVVNETIHVTDSPVVTPSVMLLVPETITVTDTPNVLPSVMLTVPETITVTDTPEITVQSPNVPPVAQDVSVVITAGQPITITLLATDPNTDPLTFAIVTGPAHGSLSAVSGNQVTYTPAFGYVGGDAFTFRANDGQADSNVATVSIGIAVAPTTTVLTSSPNPSVGGQNVTLTATVSSPAGVPQGGVEFSYRIPGVLRAFVLGTVPVDADGVARLTTPDLFVGQIAVTAAYQGSGVFAASSAALSHSVTPAPTTTTLVSSGPTSLTTKPPVFTATVGAAGLGPATGQVEFFADGVSLGRSPVFTRNGSQLAVRGGATLSVGTHAITARYVGDTAHAASAALALDQTVWQGTYFAVDLTPAFTDPTDATAVNESNWVVGYSSPPIPPLTGFRSNAGFLYSGRALVDLGGLGGQITLPLAINDAGLIVGQSTNPSREGHAFAYQAGQMADLGTLGGSTSRALAVNNIGLIVGSADTASATHGFLYQGGTMTDLGALGGTDSSAAAVNADGSIAGRASLADGTGRAAYYTTSWFDLGTLGGTTSRAVAINDAGQVAGIADLAGDLDAHAFLWGGGQMTDLAGANGPSSMPSALNDAGQAVGWTFDPLTWGSHDVSPAPLRAFFHSGGGFAELGTLSGGRSQALDVSNAGLLVGLSDGHAFVSAGGALTDLGTLGGPTSFARAINDRGVIVGSADTASGLRHATAWLPVPVSTLTLAPATGVAGGTTALVATLSAFGLPIPNATVTFSLNGVAVGSGTTSASGAATLPDVSLAGLSPGSYPGVVHADLAASSVLGGSSAKGDLTVVSPPIAADDAYTTAEDAPLSVAAPGVLGNDSNVSGGIAGGVSGPSHGTLVFRTDGSFDYTPAANFFGTDTFTYRVKVGGAKSNAATVTLTVTPVDDPPVAVDDSYAIGLGTLTVPAPGVLGNDTDVDGDPLTAVLVSGPAHGVLNLAADGSFTYTPGAAGPVIDTFRYRAIGAGVASNVATVSLLADAVSPVLGGLVSSPRVTINGGPGDQTDPHVDGDLMTYTDAQGNSARIRYYNFATDVDQGVPAGAPGEIDLLSDVNRGRIAFSRVRTNGTTAIMLFDTTTSNATPTEIDPTPGSSRFSAAIVADTIAFSDAISGNGDIEAWDLASAQAQVVGASPLLDENPHVSPDGQAIVWARCTTGCDISKAQRAGGVWNVSPVTSARNSPGDADTDGTWIVYDAEIPGSTGQDVYLTHIYLTPLAGGSEARLVLPGVQRNPHISHGVISFESTPTLGGNADLYVYVIASNALYQVTNTPSANEILSDVSVLPDGDIRVVWAADDDTLTPGLSNVYATTFTPTAAPPPPTAAASGSAAICPGSSTLLTGSGGASCSWSPAIGLDNANSCTPAASPAATTTYSLTVTDGSGRSSTNNPTVTVTVNTPPTAVASGSATINAGQSTPLSGSGGVSCSWSPATGLDNAGSCTPIGSPAVTTTYTLTVTNAGGCFSSNAPTVTVTVVQPKRRLTVTKTGVGTGTVTSGPAGISCGTTCSAQFDGGTAVTLTATPNATFVFGGWTGDPDCADGVVTMTADKTCTAAFNRRPDLVVSALATSAPGTPAVAGANTTIIVTDTTRNSAAAGGPAFPGVSTTKIYLSRDTVLDASDTLLGARSVPQLGPGASDSGATSVTIPAGAAGSYFLIAVADADGQVPETSETNNTRALAIRVGPDLRVSALSAPAKAGSGDTISVGDTTANATGVFDALPSRTGFYLSRDTTLDAGDAFLGNRWVGVLAAGANEAATTSLTLPTGLAPGTWYVIAKADYDSMLGETNETNNERSRALLVGPDLLESALTAGTSVAAGGSITIRDTARNNGGGTAGPSTSRIYLSTDAVFDPSDVPLASRSVGALGPGQTSPGTALVVIPKGTAPGSYFLIAVADDDRQVAETDETNNTRSRALTVN